MFKLWLLTGLLFCLNSEAKQKFYKWTDKKGNTHYTSKKPTDKATSEVSINTIQPVVVAPTNETQTLGDKNQENLSAYYKKKEESQIQNKQSKINQQNCQKAKRNLAAINNHSRCGWVDGKTGESKDFLQNDQRAKLISRSKAAIRKHCK